MSHEIAKSDPDYARKVQEKESLQTIANSIQEQGIINPVIVYKYGEKYRLIAGERRTLASLMIGKTEIQAKILDAKPSELKISLLQWMENVERKDLSLWERLKNLEKILSTYAAQKSVTLAEVNPTDLSHLIGCSLPHAMNYKAVLHANDAIKTLIRDQQVRNLEKAALLVNIQSKELQQTAIDACLSGATLKKLKMIATQDKTQKSLANKVAIVKAGGRGRQPTLIKLGATKKVNVAKVIFDSVLRHEKLSYVNKHVILSDLNWSDYRTVSQAFKRLLIALEKVEA